MKALSNKLIIESLSEEQQVNDASVLSSRDIYKKYKVLGVGDKVVNVKIGDVITIYFMDVLRYDSYSYCSESNVVFVNDVPPGNRIHLVKTKTGSGIIHEGIVISTSDDNLKKGDVVVFTDAYGLDLPDGTLIVGSNQVYSIIN